MKAPLRTYPEAYRAAKAIHERHPLPVPLNLSRLLDCMGTYKIHDLSAQTFNRTCAQNKREHLHPKRAWTIYDQTLDIYLIVWNKALGRASIRYSIAHELGHILLNHERGWPTDRVLGKSRKENEANAFARYLLVPFPALQKLFRAQPFSAQAVADHFDIPYAAAAKIYPDYAYWQLKKHNGEQEDRQPHCDNA